MSGPSKFRERRAQLNAAARLQFAKQVLAWLALMCAAIIAAYGCFPANPALAAAFDLVRIGALPLLSLVLSFYFASSAKSDG
jgi:hypothetical protein